MKAIFTFLLYTDALSNPPPTALCDITKLISRNVHFSTFFFFLICFVFEDVEQAAEVHDGLVHLCLARQQTGQSWLVNNTAPGFILSISEL